MGRVKESEPEVDLRGEEQQVSCEVLMVRCVVPASRDARVIMRPLENERLPVKLFRPMLQHAVQWIGVDLALLVLGLLYLKYTNTHKNLNLNLCRTPIAAALIGMHTAFELSTRCHACCVHAVV